MGDELLVRAAIKDELSGPLEEIREELRQIGDQAETTGRKANVGARGFDKMAAGAAGLAKGAGRGLTTVLAATAAGIAAVTAAATIGAVKLVSWATDAAESASKFATVFAGVDGDVAGYVDSMSARFGLVKADLMDAASTFGVFGKAAGVPRDKLGEFSKSLVSAGGDLASFYNADPTEVFQALRSGLAGEAEPLRAFGIFLSDATMQAKAATMGLSGDLTESQKVMVRQAIILESLGDAQGDLERTSGGLANQWRGLTGRLRNAGTEIGKFLLPAVLRVTTALNNRLGPIVDRLTVDLPQLGAAIGEGRWNNAAEIIDQMTGAGGRLAPVVRDLAHAILLVPNLAKALGSGDTTSISAALANALGDHQLAGPIAAVIDEVKGVAADAAAVLTGILLPAVSDVATAIDPAWLSPLGAARAALGFLADNTFGARTALVAIITVLTLAKAITLGYNAVTATAAALTTGRAIATGILTGLIRGNTVATAGNTAATNANRVAVLLHTAVSKGIRGAVLAWTAAQWLLNAALFANPVGLVVLAIAGLIALFVLAYKKSDTFREFVDKTWESLKQLGGMAMDAGKKIGSWITDKIGAAVDKLKSLGKAIRNSPLAKFLGGLDGDSGGGGGGGPMGDTATSRARGGGSFAGTMAGHASALAATSGRGPVISNAFTGGGGRGRGSGDHQAGRALDLVGSGLGSYAKAIRSAGGYAAMHGSGANRHLHAVPAQRGPAGDTSRSMVARVRPRSTGGGGGGGMAPVVLGEGSVVVYADNDLDLEGGIARGIAAYVRDQEERGA